MWMEAKRMKTARNLLLLSGGIAWVSGPAVQAQTSYGGIVGTVSDSSGADLSGAKITVTDTGTNIAKTATSGKGGTFSFNGLIPGNYTVQVSHAGFNSFTQNSIDVTIGGNTRVDAALTVGNVATNVTVTGSSVTQLQTDSATLGGVVEGRQVVESPLNGRNVNNLLDFIPGVVPGGGTSGNTMANGGSGSFQAGAQTQAIAYGNYQIGGGFSGQSLFYIDGVESNVPENNVNSLVPTQDAVQEFRVSTNDISSEFGGYAGGVIQISTKSGTNTFHGTAYEYFRNTVLDANDYFSNHEGLARPPLHQNQFGGNLGGPILKNKLFFFFSYERETLTSGSISTYTLPTAAELGGDFRALGVNIYSPTTGQQYSCNGQANVICTAQLDPTALKILQLESPLPNRPGLTNNYVATAPIVGAQNQYNARVDYTRGNDSLFARYTFWNPHNGDSDPLGTKTGAGPTGNTTTEAVLGDNHVFNPSTIGDLRLSWLENYNFQVPLSNGFDQSTINSNYGALQAQQVNNHQGLLPGLGIAGGYGVGAELSQLYWLNTVYSINGSITKVAGRHTIKMGGDGRQIEWTGYGNNQGANLSATANFTASPSDPTSGNGLASFLVGVPSGTGISEVGTIRAFLHSYAFYVSDTWQTTNKLTLDLGLRWEQPGAYSEVNNNDTILEPNLATNLGSVTNTVTGTSNPVVGGLVFVDSPQYGSRREEALHWKLFSPRIGADYRLTNTMVIRGGYGISYLPAEITADSPAGSPINSAGTNIGNTPGTALNATVDNPFPNGILLPSGRNPAGLTAVLGQSIGSRIPNQSYGYAQQWNLGFQQALDSETSFALAYAGAKGTHLVLSEGFTGTGFNLNQLPDQYDAIGGTPASGNNPGTGLFTAEKNPLAGKIPTGGQLGGPTILQGYLLKRFPQYQNVNQVVPRTGSSTYEALQATLNRRFSHGGLIQVAYTWAKLLSDTDNTSAFEDGQGGQGVVQDFDNIQAEKSISLQDLTNNLVINYGVELPFGKGQMFLGSSNGIVNAVVGGWRANGITTFHSGLPIPFSAGGTNYLAQYFGAGAIRPNIAESCAKPISGSAQSRADKWFNTACFSQPGQFSFGNETRVDNTLRSAGAANFDFSINKNFPLYDRFTGKFSLETFNLFNRAQFGAPDSNVNDGAFGTVTHQANLPRTLQFAMRVSF
jgi:outer membrane receptor protein involved in Fe transport